VGIPDYQTLMLPLLTRLALETEPVSINKYVSSIADEFQLTEEERSARIPSGMENLLSNRLAWARTYLVKAGLLQSPKRGVVSITQTGQELIQKRPTRIDIGLLKGYTPFAEWMRRSQSSAGPSSNAKQTDNNSSLPLDLSSTSTPHERIEAAQQELEAALRSDLLDRVRVMSPSDFEALVIQLLLNMGYGDGQEEMAKALGGTGDGGVDGVISQDPLGLERVYIQAKRWKENNNVGSSGIRDFIGALNIKRASKGVFVTASEFTSEARNAANSSTMSVVLIDGEKLAELMVRHEVGVLVRTTIKIKALDEGFFEE
jgi:restriction system protein